MTLTKQNMENLFGSYNSFALDPNYLLDEAMADKEFELLSTIRYLGNEQVEVEVEKHGKVIGSDNEDDKTSHDGGEKTFHNGDGNTAGRNIKISDKNFFQLPLHYERLKYQLSFFQWNVQLTYKYLLDELIATLVEAGIDLTQDYKMRVLLGPSGSLRVESHQLTIPLVTDVDKAAAQRQNLYTVHVNDQPTLIGPFTSFKTTNRDHYTRARNSWIKGDGDQEVLLWNGKGEVMEATITNLAIERDGRWVTPELSSGGLCGVMRQYLVGEGLIDEGMVMKEELEDGQPVLVFNAIMGLRRGVLKIRESK